MNAPNGLAGLRRLMVDRLRDEDVQNTCFDLNVDFENLGGTGKAGKVRELLIDLENHDRIADLLNYLRTSFPDIPWPDSVPVPHPGDPAAPPHARQGEEKLRILMLSANPESTSPLRLDEEARSIDLALQQAAHRERVELITAWAVRTSDLQPLLLRHNPQVVHFSGHGSSSSAIILEGAAGRGVAVPAAALATLFGVFADTVRCVVLNACYSDDQARAIARSIPVVIGMSGEMYDESARVFSPAFYRALAYGRSLQNAFDLGKADIKLELLPGDAIPKLIVRGGIDPTALNLLPPG